MAAYSDLGKTHVCDEPYFYEPYLKDPVNGGYLIDETTGEYVKNPAKADAPMGTDYYLAQKDSWGKGGRIAIYDMYENGGLFYGRYEEKCGHAHGTNEWTHARGEDKTSAMERADYLIYAVNKRVDLAKEIFGEDCLLDGSKMGLGYFGGDIVAAAQYCHSLVSSDEFGYCQHDINYAVNTDGKGHIITASDVGDNNYHAHEEDVGKYRNRLF